MVRRRPLPDLLARMLLAGLATACGDTACPDWWGGHPTGPRTGEACDTRDFERCSVDPQADPWVYECVEGRLRVVRNGLDQTERCVLDGAGGVTQFGIARDLKAGHCHSPEEVPDGPSTGDSCPVEGGTQCAADSATDPYFYLCRDGVLQVFDHARFRGGAQCEMGEFGPPVVRYFDF